MSRPSVSSSKATQLIHAPDGCIAENSLNVSKLPRFPLLSHVTRLLTGNAMLHLVVFHRADLPCWTNLRFDFATTRDVSSGSCLLN